MSLTWFPFNADAYTGDTGHLTCEEHGAYLLLMLAYYRSEKPLPARDRSLAATCKLSLDAWMEAKESIAAFFREVDGFWHHDVIDETIRTQNKKIDDANERAKSGAAKRWAGHTPKPKPPPKNASGNAQALPDASPPALPEQSLPITDLDLDLEKNSLSLARERASELVPEEGSQEPPEPASSVGHPIAPDWKPMDDWIRETAEDSPDVGKEIAQQIAIFIAHHQERATFSANWDASWIKWWSRYLDWKAKQPKPRVLARVVVDTGPDAFVPTTKQWEKAVEMLAKGMRWPKAGYGGEPGMLGCVCPPEIIRKFGLDPATGMKLHDDTTAN